MYKNSKEILEDLEIRGFKLSEHDEHMYKFERPCSGEISTIIFAQRRVGGCWNVEFDNYAPYASMIKIVYDILVYLENNHFLKIKENEYEECFEYE